MILLFLKKNWALVIIIIIAAIVRFIGLTWCFPFTPHPDEFNMALAITRLNWGEKLNPQFYAYGQFPLYLSYFSATLYNQIPWIKIQQISVQEAIFFLRFWSALAGTGIVYLVYLISKKLFFNKSLITNYQLLIAPLLAAFTPGLIQISHFGTTESLLSFFFLFLLFLSLKISEEPKTKFFVFSGTVLGLALGTKISALTFLAPLGMSLLIILLHKLKRKSKLAGKIKFLSILAGKFFITLTLALALAILTSPYLLLAFKESRGTLLYEISVANGSSPVFYTRQFLDTTPVLFQLEKIFPYALGWPIFILGISGLLITLITLISLISHIPLKKNLLALSYFVIIIFSFLVYFFSQAFLFCKWTRFMSPVFAFFPIFAAITLSYLRNLRILRYLIVFLALIPGIIFTSIYCRPDIRFIASEWIYQNIPSGSKILYDTGNVVDIPILPPNYQNIFTGRSLGEGWPNYSIVSFDFYHLDENPQLYNQLLSYLQSTDYIIIPSRRIFKNFPRFPKIYPKIAKYYDLLFSGKLGFTEIKVFHPYPSFQIFPLSVGIPPTAVTNFKFQIDDEQSEETFTVFDHPVIRIYKKTKSFNENSLETLF